MHHAHHITIVAQFELTYPREDFEDALRALVRRVEAEGVPDLLAYQFYTSPHSSKGGGVITFANEQAMRNHQQLVADWEEYLRLQTMMKLVDLRLFGTFSETYKQRMAENSPHDPELASLPDGIDDWFAGDHFVGFVRWQPVSK
jgi:hypothetical protein